MLASKRNDINFSYIRKCKCCKLDIRMYATLCMVAIVEGKCEVSGHVCKRDVRLFLLDLSIQKVFYEKASTV